MELSHAIELRNSLRDNRVIMAYNGTVSDELMLTLADMLKARLLAHDDSKRSKLIFSVFMEGVQNLIWHGKENDDDHGMILITEVGNEITILCGNRILKSETHDLKERLDRIAGADKETIRQMYRDGMAESGEHEGRARVWAYLKLPVDLPTLLITLFRMLTIALLTSFCRPRFKGN